MEFYNGQSEYASEKKQIIPGLFEHAVEYFAHEIQDFFSSICELYALKFNPGIDILQQEARLLKRIIESIKKRNSTPLVDQNRKPTQPAHRKSDEPNSNVLPAPPKHNSAFSVCWNEEVSKAIRVRISKMLSVIQTPKSSLLVDRDNRSDDVFKSLHMNDHQTFSTTGDSMKNETISKSGLNRGLEIANLVSKVSTTLKCNGIKQNTDVRSGNMMDEDDEKKETTSKRSHLTLLSPRNTTKKYKTTNVIISPRIRESSFFPKQLNQSLQKNNDTQKEDPT